jgi:hypothetical protein
MYFFSHQQHPAAGRDQFLAGTYFSVEHPGPRLYGLYVHKNSTSCFAPIVASKGGVSHERCDRGFLHCVLGRPHARRRDRRVRYRSSDRRARASLIHPPHPRPPSRYVEYSRERGREVLTQQPDPLCTSEVKVGGQGRYRRPRGDGREQWVRKGWAYKTGCSPAAVPGRESKSKVYAESRAGGVEGIQFPL